MLKWKYVIFLISTNLTATTLPLSEVHFSVLQGEEKWEEIIMELMDAVDAYIPIPPRENEKPFLMPVEDVFITGRGTVATGRIETGVVHTSDELEIIGLGIQKRKTVCTGVEMFRKISTGAKQAIMSDFFSVVLIRKR